VKRRKRKKNQEKNKYWEVITSSWLWDFIDEQGTIVPVRFAINKVILADTTKVTNATPSVRLSLRVEKIISKTNNSSPEQKNQRPKQPAN